MIQSMTGFGKHVVNLPNKKINIEIKSLNSKNLDINARMPSQYREKELSLRGLIGKTLTRGKIDFSLYVENTGNETASSINPAVVKNYINSLKLIISPGESKPQEELAYLQMAMRLPDALKTEKEEIDEQEYQAIELAVNQALAELLQFRKDEGLALEKDFKQRIKTLHQLLDEVLRIDPERVRAVKDRLQKSISELKEQVDENRFEQELIYYIEKYDITEEKIRLENHLEYFTKTLDSPDSNGKKLGFITQEIGREINTIGSKSNYAPMQKLVVQMKDELEKIKEQLLNVL
ncbi:YicC/YloC family endoribonuclease [Mesonia sp. HuA40]|uniref:YicC/YloC family endoribonuclease n=1 Tax=Mesonia sp. HuA40 TaxID=2602761 RepID=UPI0011CC10D4|nr:YicC/YloC family endoribonuclease [Mesonia sp. HuA40]TXK72505.1 YicC family protein [Mesonia sp. HuA40]